jgi:glycosyltransferase involved in cell wall biosynthesis
MPTAYAAADITAIPSYGESFCLTATESMACETPVIGYDVGGLGEQLTSEVGWIVDPDDLTSLSASLNEALANEKLRNRKGRAARRRVQEYYRIERTVDQYFELYRRILVK